MMRNKRKKTRKTFSSNFKKGNVFLDSMTWIVIAFIMIVAIIFGKMIFTEVNSTVQADDYLSPENKARVDTLNTNYAGFFDGLFMFVLILLVIMVLVASFMIDAHPVFFIVSLILFFVIMFVGAMLSNGIQELGSDADISASYNQFPNIIFVVENFVAVVVIVGFFIMLALYAKNRLMS